MTPLVVDASVTMAWCFEDEATPGAEAVLDRLVVDGGVVPAIWSFEVANVLLVAERRQRLTEASATRFLGLLDQLPIDVDDGPVDPAILVATGRRHGLSAYDAAYLALAERLAATLATLDERLAGAATAAGVAVIGARPAPTGPGSPTG